MEQTLIQIVEKEKKMKKDVVEMIDTLELIDMFIDDYTKLMKKAMDENDETKVFQFNGSIISLSILKDNLERRL